MNQPKISVVTVCFNAIETIEKTILSVLNQNYENVEYIIIDGGSKDGTVDIIKKYSDRLYYWISEPDKGIYNAMNKGIKRASGLFINFMNSGDTYYDNNVISQVVQSLKEDTIIAYGQLMRIYKNFRILSYTKPIELDELKGNARLPHQAMFTRLDYHKEHIFDESFRSAADFNFYYQAYFKDKCKTQYLPFLIANYDSDTGMSKDNPIGIIETRRIQGDDLTQFEIYALFVKNVLRKVIKKILPNSIYARILEFRLSRESNVIIK